MHLLHPPATTRKQLQKYPPTGYPNASNTAKGAHPNRDAPLSTKAKNAGYDLRNLPNSSIAFCSV